MQIQFTDHAKTSRNLEIQSGPAFADDILYITEHGELICELVNEEGVWMEPYRGVTKKSREFGGIVEKFYTVPITSFKRANTSQVNLLISL
ncbi:MAG: hypothetical protein EOO02_16145 [Chitinophagaceae bacterium]|nr:MAG: hypothetical protein EOO02_16145 [Chitinophagaceae bacterium]